MRRLIAKRTGERVSSRGIMAPYTPGSGRFSWTLRLVMLLIISALAGAAIPLFPFADAVVAASVIFSLFAGLILWMLPDRDWEYGPVVAGFLIIYLWLSALWPPYVAVNVAGLPWVTPPRAWMGALALVFLVAIATSREARREFTDARQAMPGLTAAALVFWLATLLTLPLSPVPVTSLREWANDQVFWLVLPLTALCVMSTKEGPKRIERALTGSALIVASLGILESAIGRIFWIGHIPSFLSVSADYMESVITGQFRAFDSTYRARSTFTLPLLYSEYLSIILPFFIYRLFNSKIGVGRFFSLISYLVVVAGTLASGSRSGIIGIILSHFGYLFLWSYRHWRSNKFSLVAPTVLFGFPFIVTAFSGLILSSHTLYTKIFGGGQHQASDMARSSQWELGWSALKANPLGHGVGNAGRVIGYTNIQGKIVLDNYILTLYGDYGIVGLISYTLIFVFAIIACCKLFITSRRGDDELSAPLGCSLGVFLFLRQVNSAEVNQPLAFMLVAIVAGLVVARRRQASDNALTTEFKPSTFGGRSFRPSAQAIRT